MGEAWEGPGERVGKGLVTVVLTNEMPWRQNHAPVPYPDRHADPSPDM